MINENAAKNHQHDAYFASLRFNALSENLLQVLNFNKCQNREIRLAFIML